MENQDEQKENLNEQLKGSDADYAYSSPAEDSNLNEELKGSDADYAASGDENFADKKPDDGEDDRNESMLDAEEAGLS